MRVQTPDSRSRGIQDSSAKREISGCRGHMTKEKRPCISSLTLHCRKLEEKKRKKKKNPHPKASRRNEIIKIRVEVNEIEARKIRERVNETKHSLSERSAKLTAPW